MTDIIVTSRAWHEDMPKRLRDAVGEEFLLINNKVDLTAERLRASKPRYVFFPHWSHIVPPDIYENFECVIFHMTDVPFGRGGSPLQNLIARGIYETKISALKCGGEIDAGPVYMKSSLSLYGSAEEIFIRASKVIEGMIISIIKDRPAPAPQTGEAVNFARRKPEDSNIVGLMELEKVFDYIRMLDGDGYPRAFMETDNLRLEFERASLKDGAVIADVKITKRIKK